MSHVVMHHTSQPTTYFVQSHRSPNKAITNRFPVNLTAIGEILQCFRCHLPQFANNTKDLTQACTDLQSLIHRRTRISSPDTW
jgi:hypothetical protein